jgi:hypothetical protein
MLASFTTVPNNGLFSTAFFLTLALMDEDLSRKPGDLGCRKISNTLAIQERSQEFDDKHPLLLDDRPPGHYPESAILSGWATIVPEFELCSRIRCLIL